MGAAAVRSRVTDLSSAGLAGLPDEYLEAELCQLAADIAAGTARWFRLIAEYDRRQVWASWECRSMAAWLAGHVGVSPVTARQYVQVARTLEHYPLLAAEFDAGRLSYSRVRVVCRVITPTSEADLVSMARNATAAQLERFVRGVERSALHDAPADPDAQRQRCEVALIADDDGTWILRGRLSAEAGAALRRALDTDMYRERQREPQADPSPDRRTLRHETTFEHRQANALTRVVMAGHGALETENDAAASVRPLVIVHRYPDGDELESGPVISREEADRLSLNADHLEATHHQTRHANGVVIDVRITYRRRTANRAQRRALTERDQCCRFPGCTNRASLHAHHLREYHRGGFTITINLILVCSMHHHAIHRNGWIITGHPNDKLEFTRPGLTPPTIDDGNLESIIDHFTGPITPAMRGERFDLGLAVSTFLHNETIKNSPQPHISRGKHPTNRQHP